MHAVPALVRARDAAGRPDLRFHDLRHSGAVLAAATGATLAELMARLGHCTPQAAMRYQHVAAGRGREIAAAAVETRRHLTARCHNGIRSRAGPCALTFPPIA